jgi:CubicO group peptidase (beta-lactamase class C family)
MTYAAFGAMNASIRDMGRFLTALLNDGQVPGAAGLPAGLVTRFFRPDGTLASDAGLEVGYGAGIYGRVRDGHVFLGHGGDADGYRSRYGVLPVHGRGYALVINTDNPRLLRRLEQRLESALTADLPVHQPPARSAEDLAPYAGTYYPSSSRFRSRPASAPEATVSVHGRTLRFEADDRVTPLYPVGAGRFVRPGDPAVTVVFVRDGDQLYLQGELGNFVNLSRGPCPDFLGACE